MFQKASNLSDTDDVYASENLREALELCQVQKKMINDMKKALEELKEDIEENDG